LGKVGKVDDSFLTIAMESSQQGDTFGILFFETSYRIAPLARMASVIGAPRLDIANKSFILEDVNKLFGTFRSIMKGVGDHCGS